MKLPTKQLMGFWQPIDEPDPIVERRGLRYKKTCAIAKRCLLVCCLALVANYAVAAKDPAVPRVLSINLCADQLVLLLADSQQIVGLSTLSREVAGSYYHEMAKDYPQVDPLAEQILPLQPDIIVTGPFTSRYTLALLAELGFDVITLSLTQSLQGLYDNVLLVGKHINQAARAEQLVSDLQRRVEHIVAMTQSHSTLAQNSNRRPRAAVYDANGYTVGNETLRGQALSLSGWNNVASEKGIQGYGKLSLEALIQLRPDALIESPYSPDTYSRGQQVGKHPALRKSAFNPHRIRLASNETICAGPWTVGVIEQLHRAARQVQQESTQ